ncbi:MAG: PAS domain-containing protein, partial [Gammaproteobacteria bacterium]|nr:PAS domain-containing protein [Gammaproteobacteria bacterium]
MNTSMEVALLHKLLKQTTAAYEEKLSELTTSQQAFQESESRLNTILDTIDAYVYVKDRQGRYLYVNEITRKLWGVDNDHVIGNTDEAFFDAKTAKSIKANDRLILDQGQTIRSEERNRVRGGLESRVYLSTKMPLLNANGDVEALLGVSTDITERVQAEEQLRIAALVYDNSDEAIIVTDADNQVIAINPAFTAITGYTESEVVGRPISQFDPLIDPPGFYADLGTRLDENGAWKGQIWHKVENNVRLALLVSVNTVHDRKGHIEKRVALYSDITEKTISEEAIWHHANYDELTHLPNRRLFFELLERQIKAAHRAKAKFALMFLDLDHFKEINDTL